MSYSLSTPGKTPAIAGACFMGVSMFFPYLSISGWTQMTGNAIETSAGKIMLAVSVVAAILAFVDTMATKIGYVIYACYCVFFCFYNVKSMKEVMDYTNDIVDKEFGYYCVIIATIVIAISAVVLLIHVSDDTRYTPVQETHGTSAFSNLAMGQGKENLNRIPKSNEWRCSCGRINPDFTGTCTCGKRRHAAAPSSVKKPEDAPVAASESAAEPASEKPKTADTSALELEKNKVIEEYKELLDSGIITQEEFEEKKKQLL